MSNIDFTKMVVSGIVASLLDSQKPTSSNIDENLFYVNGILTDVSKSQVNMSIVNKYFGVSGRRIYNPTDDLKDLKEAIQDYKWGIEATMFGKFPDPLINQTTLQVIARLQVAKDNQVPIALVGSSQGSLITYNAIFAFSLMDDENKEFLKSCVRVCHLGVVIPHFNEIRMHSLLNKYKAVVNPKDPVSTIIGLKADPKSAIVLSTGTAKYHNLKWYLPIEDYQNVMEEYGDNVEPFVRKKFLHKPFYEL